MSEIYFLKNNQQLLLLLYSCLLLIKQTTIFHLALTVGKPHKRSIFFQEAFILAYIFLLTFSLCTPIISLQSADIALNNYDTVRYSLGVLALTTAFWGRQTVPTLLTLIVVVILTTPWSDNFGLMILLPALVILAIRDVLVLRHIKQLRQEQIFPGEIKSAIDSLPVGIVFALDNGEIFLANTMALKYMYSDFGHYFGDINELWRNYEDYKLSQCLDKKVLGKDLLLRLSPEKSLLLSFDTLQTPKKKILQLLIKDITTEDQSNLQLQRQNAALIESSSKIKGILANLEAFTHERVVAKLRFYMHDLMGQHLTILQQGLNGNTEIDYGKFLPILDEFLNDMKKIKEQTLKTKLDNIITTYKNIGITVNMQGKLPQSQEIAKVFVAIIREGITNAVRHGHCDTVTINIYHQAALDTLDIEDNGLGCPAHPVFGTGLKGITKRLEEINGILEVRERPKFILHCEVKSTHD